MRGVRGEGLDACAGGAGVVGGPLMAGRGACAALLALAAVFTLLARGTVAGDATYNPCDPLPDYLK